MKVTLALGLQKYPHFTPNTIAAAFSVSVCIVRLKNPSTAAARRISHPTHNVTELTSRNGVVVHTGRKRQNPRRGTVVASAVVGTCYSMSALRLYFTVAFTGNPPFQNHGNLSLYEKWMAQPPPPHTHTFQSEAESVERLTTLASVAAFTF